MNLADKFSNSFDPDRWLDERNKRHKDNPFIFMPFIAGPRIVG